MIDLYNDLRGIIWLYSFNILFEHIICFRHRFGCWGTMVNVTKFFSLGDYILVRRQITVNKIDMGYNKGYEKKQSRARGWRVRVGRGC